MPPSPDDVQPLWPLWSPSRTPGWSRLIALRHHGAAWVPGPLLIGLTAVFLAAQSDYASNLNNLLFSAIPFAPSLAAGTGIGENIAACLAGVTREPITSIVSMMEMTSSYRMLLPLMAKATAATGTSRLVCPARLCQTLAEQFLRGLPDPIGRPSDTEKVQSK